MRRPESCGAAALLGVAIALAATAAPAAPRALRPGGPQDGFVVAESRFGNGTVTGPVRFYRHGPQVRLPGGTWVYCRRSCAETLRVETVDFWEAKGLGGGTFDNECGIFGCLELHWPR
jgi:hypothetical protein